MTHTSSLSETQSNLALPQADPARGLTRAQVEEMRSLGNVNTQPERSGRSALHIVRDNVFTRINFMLGTLFVLVMTTGSWINGAFGLLIIANSIIGIIQELRAKHTLDSLAVVGEAKPVVRRDGENREISPEEVVLGDIIVVRAGDQIIVDGIVTEEDYLEVDESLLTGESDAIDKSVGDSMMSGSFVVSGSGTYQASRVGKDSYAAQLTAEASKFSLVDSQLQQGIDRILHAITWVLVPVGILTIIGQIRVGNGSWVDIILSVCGALVPMIPEGLVLITSTAFALGVIRLGRMNVLVNELPAIEGLARVDTVAADKTGTLTENKLTFGGIELINSSGSTPEDVREALAQLGSADTSPNSSMEAIIAEVGIPEKPWTVVSRQPFTSAKKWSGVTFHNGTHNWVLGAPDVLLQLAQAPEASARAEEIAKSGQRVLLLALASENVTATQAPGTITPVAFILLDQKLREDASDTLRYFTSQGVDIKVISGDNAQAVGAVTRNLGVDIGEPVDARAIRQEEFVDVINSHQVFGRVTPDQKRAMVKAMQERGHTVAMTGDGVNDVLALKDADLGIGMGSGTPSTRSVAKIVLLDDKFASLPYVVAEGRRVAGNIERVARLFLTKTVYSAVLAICVLLFSTSYPFVPIHVTITGWFTIGIPAFILSLPSNNQKARDGFVGRVMRFGFPSGVIVGISTFFTYYYLSEYATVLITPTQISTATLITMIVGSTWVLATVARPYTWWKILLVCLPVIGYTVIFSLPIAQHYFLLDSSNMWAIFVGLAVGCIAALGIESLWWALGKRHKEDNRFWQSREEKEQLREQAQLRERH
ncbi:HAD-IC family P-type ATPase [Actinotignum urinale]|uniref:HAD-IC family P-type ATPase n=1 Tax=Actinotignum urinale TaxID=190146 RepID=UPI0003B47AB3|nr:HAD-IC family P-type ATPase [Actinotignum urinale]MDY5160431.1 HAD-IC family P-type ATPase [Actinotignum urinale]WIK59687.1 HAD-IC family P-type ATPase [Actinotignum urinale]